MVKESPVSTAPRVTNIADLLMFVRVRDWAHFLLLPLVTAELDPFGADALLRGVLLSGGCLAFAYGWNEWNDAEVEAGFPTAPPATLRALLAAILVATITLAIYSGLVPLLATAASLGGGALYSGGPRLKRLPVIGTVSNAWIFVPLCLLGRVEPDLSAPTLVLLLAFTAVLLQNQLFHEAAHGPADRAASIDTTFTRFGPRASGVVAALLGVAGVASVVTLGALASPSWAFLLAALPVAVITAVAASPGSLADPARAAHLRSWQRYAGLASGGIAWLLLQGVVP